MLNLHQLITSSIAHQANKDAAFHVRDFNALCNQITDYMAYCNLSFTNVHLYLTRLHGVANQLNDAVHKSYVSRPKGSDPISYFYSVVSSLYTSVMENNRVLADQVRWPMDSEGETRFNPTFSNTIISVIPGKLVLDTNTSAMIGPDRSTVEENGYLKTFLPYRHMMQAYREYSNDPVYGDGRYGVMPYVMPFIPTSFTKKMEEEMSFTYLADFNKARELYAEALVLKIDVDNHSNKYTEFEDSESEEARKAMHIANQLENELDSMTHKIAELIFNSLQNMAFEYNEGHTLSLPRKEYVISNNR